MKRGLTALVTFTRVGYLVFMGAAGTAAAQDSLVGIGSDVDIDQDATSGVEVTNDQTNSNDQTQAASSTTSEAISLETTARARPVVTLIRPEQSDIRI